MQTYYIDADLLTKCRRTEKDVEVYLKEEVDKNIVLEFPDFSSEAGGKE